MTRSKDIGTQVETATVKWLRPNGWPHAERRALHGSTDLGDITGTPGVVWECKGGKAAENASDGLVEAWLEETEQERRNANADFGVLVMKRKGIGPARAGEWWAVLRAGAFIDLFGLCDDSLPATWWDLEQLPIRTHLASVALALRHQGFGDPL